MLKKAERVEIGGKAVFLEQMKTIYTLIILLITSLMATAQKEVKPAYQRFPTIPPLSLNAPNGKLLSKGDLKKNAPVLIMYFSPECDHCQQQTREMTARMKDLEHVQIVMASYQPLESLEAFSKTYNLGKFSNILLGRDSQFLLPPFYNIGSLPFLALYDKKGNFISIHEGNVSVDKLIAALK